MRQGQSGILASVVCALLIGGAGHTSAQVQSGSAAVNVRAQNSWFGSTGGVHMIDASSGEEGSLRISLGVDFFRSHGFLASGDTHQQLAGTLAVSGTPIEHLELFASFSARSNSNNRSNPILLQVVGDLSAGVKSYAQITPWLSAGGDVRALLLNTIGDLGVTGGATSVGFRAALNADFRQGLAVALPLLARVNVGYLLDNSSKLIENVERERYAALPTATRRSLDEEDRQLITRVERFGLGIDRVDLLTFNVGLEVPLPVARDFWLQPLVEWELGIPVNRQGYDCLSVPTDATRGDSDGCLGTSSFASRPSKLTAGMRVLPPARGLSVLLAYDIGLTGTRRFVRELAPTPPWALLIAIAYAADTRRPEPERIITTVSVPAAAAPAPTLLRARGTVVDHGTGAPVIGAVVRYPERELSPQLTGAEGGFISYAFPPGEVALEITHPDYDPGHCSVVLAAYSGSELTPLRCELNARPKNGAAHGVVSDEHGKPLPGITLELSGPSARSLVSTPSGEFRAGDLPEGLYAARIDAPGYLIKMQPFQVSSGSDVSLPITLIEKPKVSQVALGKTEVKLGTQIVFKPNSAEIDVRSSGLLSELADLLARNPQLTLVQVQGHTDNRGNSAQNLALSQQRAESVVQWLAGAGIDPSRLEAQGFGDQRPLVPNLTTENRARNRRVQFVIKQP